MKSTICGAVSFVATLMISASAIAGGLTPEEVQATHVMAGSEQPVPVPQSAQQVNSGPKTREQVYQELVDAERSGEINLLNATVYAH